MLVQNDGCLLEFVIALYPHEDRRRQEEYFRAVEHDVYSIQTSRLIQPNGALGTGWRHVQDGRIGTPIPVTSLTGRALADILSTGVDAKW